MGSVKGSLTKISASGAQNTPRSVARGCCEARTTFDDSPFSPIRNLTSLQNRKPRTAARSIIVGSVKGSLTKISPSGEKHWSIYVGMVAGCRVQGAGCRVQGAGCMVQGVGCGV